MIYNVTLFSRNLRSGSTSRKSLKGTLLYAFVSTKEKIPQQNKLVQNLENIIKTSVTKLTDFQLVTVKHVTYL